MKAERLHIEIEIDDREFKGRVWDDAPLDIEAFLQKEPSPLTQPQLLEIALSVEPSGKVMLIPSRGFPNPDEPEPNKLTTDYTDFTGFL